MVSFTQDFLKALQESFSFNWDTSWCGGEESRQNPQTIDEYLNSIRTLGELEFFWKLSTRYVNYSVYNATSRSFFGSMVKVIDRLLLSVGLDAGLIELLSMNYEVYSRSGKESCYLLLSQLEALQSIASYEEKVLINQIESLVMEFRRELGE